MQLHVKGKNLPVTDALFEHAERKLGKLARIMPPWDEATEVELELSVERNPSAEPRFGAVWFEALLDIDRGERIARFDSVYVTRVEFADGSQDLVDRMAQGIEAVGPELSMSLDQLLASLEEGSGGQEARRFRHDAPRILVANEPTVLVTLDGPPRLLTLDARSSEADVATLLDTAKTADAVVAAIFLRVQTARGSITLPPAAGGALRRLLASGTRVAGVSFGTPYVLRDLPGLGTYLVAWGSQTDAQVAAARALFGEIGITGRLPVTIPGAAARGAGIRKPAEKGS